MGFIIYFIYSKITNKKYKERYYSRQLNFYTITIVITFFILCFIHEYTNSNSSFLKTAIKPFSDFFGYIVIEKYINDLFKDSDKSLFNKIDRIKIYNNWSLEINKIKRRLNLKDLNSKILGYDNITNMLNKLDTDEIKRHFINALKIKEDIGYVVWIIIVIILLEYISNDLG